MTDDASVRRAALHTAVLWHGVSLLPRLRRLAHSDRQEVLREADSLCEQYPLYLMPDARFLMPSWSDSPLTGGQVIALLVFGLWVQCREDEQIAGPLLRDWPEIQDALSLVPREHTDTSQTIPTKGDDNP